MASMISDTRVFGINMASSYQNSYRGFWENIFYGGNRVELHGNATTQTTSQGHEPGVIVDPKQVGDPNDPQSVRDADADRDHIPQANLGEKFAHEFLGHLWGEEIMGHPAGATANMRDAIDAENAVRATDPTRGQKTKHHDQD
jgi:hypothetical protein